MLFSKVTCYLEDSGGLYWTSLFNKEKKKQTKKNLHKLASYVPKF